MSVEIHACVSGEQQGVHEALVIKFPAVLVHVHAALDCLQVKEVLNNINTVAFQLEILRVKTSKSLQSMQTNYRSNPSYIIKGVDLKILHSCISKLVFHVVDWKIQRCLNVSNDKIVCFTVIKKK